MIPEMQSSRVAVVTGCSRGVGLALVTELVKNNYKVFATCRSPSSAAQLAEVLSSLQQPPATPLDVTDEATIQQAYSTVRAATGRVDLLINNAGIATRGHPVEPCLTADVAEMNRLFATNVSGVVRTTQVFLPLLRASPRPRVINISSGLGSLAQCSKPSPGMRNGQVISYRASKAALNMATVVMCQEMPEVQFLLVHPGWVATDMGSAGGRSPDVSPAESAAGIVRVAGDDQRHSGEFIDWKGQTIPW
ncbi:C-factor-like [Pollicipes pollicipes]|uniref:C-factor-like n=1 Tax=Pollicipes pollicipes TaxID=41117 RepID=UPI0018852CF0|nr:C-factor-like [Pollicipes pollicipes]